jgi:2-polyprenyl-3-methyl-5-hydroxy-6-metoxy-1,4-benzoquinol methylase
VATLDSVDLRFQFGRNWKRFLTVLSDDRIQRAEDSLLEMLGARTLSEQRFLDIGCGSGLSSLAARRLGADVYSFDYDIESVECAKELKHRFFPEDRRWRIANGSVLDEDFMAALGTFDVVYSWGVLHHTGALWKAIDSACHAVAERGHLFIAIYNDQGWKSVWWTHAKRIYNSLPPVPRKAYLLTFGLAFEIAAVAVALARLKPQRIVERWTNYQGIRGMSRWHDIIDWIGGYPFEVATPDAIVRFCQIRGFEVTNVKSVGGRMGCNEFVFARGGGAQM